MYSDDDQTRNYEEESKSHTKTVIIIIELIIIAILAAYLIYGKVSAPREEINTPTEEDIATSDRTVQKLYNYFNHHEYYKYPTKDEALTLISFEYKQAVALSNLSLKTDTNCTANTYQITDENNITYNNLCKYVTLDEINNMYYEIFNSDNTSLSPIIVKSLYFAYNSDTNRYYSYATNITPSTIKSSLMKASKNKDVIELYEDAVELKTVDNNPLACKPETNECMSSLSDYTSMYVRYKYTFTKNSSGNYNFSKLEVVDSKEE